MMVILEEEITRLELIVSKFKGVGIDKELDERWQQYINGYKTLKLRLEKGTCL